MWKYVKSKNNSKATVPDVMEGINYADNTKGKAKIFNMYLQSVFTQQACSNTVPQSFDGYTQMPDIVISKADIVSL